MEIQPQRHRLALVLNSLFFPLTIPDSIISLSKRGYAVGPFPPRTIMYGNRSYVGGKIAEKTNVIVDIDDIRKIVGCEGTNVSSVLSTFNELLEMLNTDFSLPVNEIDFVELNSDFIVSSDGNPIQKLKVLYNDAKIMSSFEKIIGVPIGNYIVSLIHKDTVTTDKNWLNIRIEPRLTKPTKEYYVNVVFRDVKPSKVLEFTNSLESVIVKLLSEIESENNERSSS